MKCMIREVPEVGIEPTRGCPHGILSPNQGKEHGLGILQRYGPLLHIAKGRQVLGHMVTKR